MSDITKEAHAETERNELADIFLSHVRRVRAARDAFDRDQKDPSKRVDSRAVDDAEYALCSFLYRNGEAIALSLTQAAGVPEALVSPTRKCSTCGKIGTMYHARIPYITHLSDGRVTVPGMPCLMCAECEEISLTDASFAAIDKAAESARAGRGE